MSIFSFKDGYKDAEPLVRKALNIVYVSLPSMVRLMATAKSLGLNARSPWWCDTAWCHVGILKPKIAIVVVYSVSYRFKKMRPFWESEGYLYSIVRHNVVDNLSDGSLKQHLLDAVRVAKEERGAREVLRNKDQAKGKS